MGSYIQLKHYPTHSLLQVLATNILMSRHLFSFREYFGFHEPYWNLSAQFTEQSINYLLSRQNRFYFRNCLLTETDCMFYIGDYLVVRSFCYIHLINTIILGIKTPIMYIVLKGYFIFIFPVGCTTYKE